MKKIAFYFILTLLIKSGSAQNIKILFDATKAETAGNADWVIDEDLNNMTWNPNATVGSGSEGNAQRIPTPAQSTVSSSTLETYWKGAISSWGIDCVKRGYYVETLPYNGSITYGNSSNAQDLSNYKIFIVVEPNIKFTSTEKTAIINFVLNGGSLFMVSDHIVSDRNNDGFDSPQIWNDLLTNNGIQYNPFGILFDSANFSQTTTNIPNLPGDSLLNGPMGSVTQAMWSNGTSISINPTVNNSVKGVVYKTGVTFGNTSIMAAYSRYGKGKVVAIGDSSPCDDGTGDTGDQLYNGWTTDAAGNHERLIMNATIWLATKDSVISAPIIKDLSIDSIISPVSFQKGNNTVSVRLKNIGNMLLDTATISYKVDNGSATNSSITSMHILPNSFYTYQFNTPFNALNDGTYKLFVWVNANGDHNTTNDTLCSNYVLNTTGVLEISISSSISIFPNPTNERLLNIESLREEITRISINDASGKQWIIADQLPLKKVELNIISLPIGMYFITIQTAEGVSVKKWMKQ